MAVVVALLLAVLLVKLRIFGDGWTVRAAAVALRAWEYWIPNLVLAGWVWFDARSRRAPARLLWELGTFLLSVIVLPAYIARRPLKPGESREGGRDWNVFRSFAIVWTIHCVWQFGVWLATLLVHVAQMPPDVARATLSQVYGVIQNVGVLVALWVWIAPVLGALTLGRLLRTADVETYQQDT
jgi:hypothetical protein